MQLNALLLVIWSIALGIGPRGTVIAAYRSSLVDNAIILLHPLHARVLIATF